VEDGPPKDIVAMLTYGMEREQHSGRIEGEKRWVDSVEAQCPMDDREYLQVDIQDFLERCEKSTVNARGQRP